jgi:hypothetical protein
MDYIFSWFSSKSYVTGGLLDSAAPHPVQRSAFELRESSTQIEEVSGHRFTTDSPTLARALRI